MPEDATADAVSPAKTESTAEGAPSPDPKLDTNAAAEAGAEGEKKEGEQEKPRKPSIFKGLGQQMMQALKENDLHRTQGMIMGGVELDYRDYRGRTPLHVACERESLGVVRLLLERNADPNVLDAVHEIAPLHIAAHKNQGILVKHLLQHKANCNIVGVDGDTPLSKAAGKGHHKVIKILLESKQVVIDLDVRDPATNEYVKREYEAMAALGDAGMDIGPSVSAADSTANDDEGRRGRSQKQKGLNIGSANDSVRSGRSQSSNNRGRSGSRKARVMKRDRRPPISPLLKAIKRNAKIEIIKELLDAGLNAEKADEKLNRSIHCAAHYGNANTCRYLLNAKCDPTAANTNGRTPLHFAARSGHPRIVKMLLQQQGVEINYPDQFGQTPTSVAADSQIKKMLQDAGGVVNENEVKRNVSAPVSPARSASPSPSPNDRSVSPSPVDRGGREGPLQPDTFASKEAELGSKVVIING